MKDYQSILLLDLDETTFVALNEAEFNVYGHSFDEIKKFKKIHHCHTLSTSILNNGYYFYVINPAQLKKMIETIYEHGDDIIIFTSGLWLKPVLSIISQLCNLAEPVASRFKKSIFLNPQEDSLKLDFSIYGTRTLLKGYRLHGLFRSMPELRNKHYVLLDNDINHITSCDSCGYLEGIRATTDENNSDFYDKVLEKMEQAHKTESVLSPSTPCYQYPEVILKAFMQLSMNEPEPKIQ